MRSSSSAWPIDSWICSASCSAPMTSVRSPSGHGGALSSSTASAATRGADVVRRREAPCPADACAHAETGPGVALDHLDLAVAHGDELVDAVDMAGLGVVTALRHDTDQIRQQVKHLERVSVERAQL